MFCLLSLLLFSPSSLRHWLDWTRVQSGCKQLTPLTGITLAASCVTKLHTCRQFSNAHLHIIVMTSCLVETEGPIFSTHHLSCVTYYTVDWKSSLSTTFSEYLLLQNQISHHGSFAVVSLVTAKQVPHHWQLHRGSDNDMVTLPWNHETAVMRA